VRNTRFNEQRLATACAEMKAKMLADASSYQRRGQTAARWPARPDSPDPVRDESGDHNPAPSCFPVPPHHSQQRFGRRRIAHPFP
jgi:hypothetical protein